MESPSAANCGSPALNAVLTGLYLQRSCLQLVSLQDIYDTSLSLLAMHTTLTQCHLHSTQAENLDLQALSLLPLDSPAYRGRQIFKLGQTRISDTSGDA